MACNDYVNLWPAACGTISSYDEQQIQPVCQKPNQQCFDLCWCRMSSPETLHVGRSKPMYLPLHALLPAAVHLVVQHVQNWCAC
jgi:hypothetical protein